ncbi:hypothetical protein L596_000773 [Steinernema carpocapsae]|uniref:Uncharacterized protein n=1 Tax=Steinernema carpocapsae TaxID=34508 RepID=A0A4U8UKE3_STECR|nr:hypothetical protein L596_000773 [Steinernema carpocapsae]
MMYQFLRAVSHCCSRRVRDSHVGSLLIFFKEGMHGNKRTGRSIIHIAVSRICRAPNAPYTVVGKSRSGTGIRVAIQELLDRLLAPG